jgi:hypothetical protein
MLTDVDRFKAAVDALLSDVQSSGPHDDMTTRIRDLQVLLLCQVWANEDVASFTCQLTDWEQRVAGFTLPADVSSELKHLLELISRTASNESLQNELDSLVTRSRHELSDSCRSLLGIVRQTIEALGEIYEKPDEGRRILKLVALLEDERAVNLSTMGHRMNGMKKVQLQILTQDLPPSGSSDAIGWIDHLLAAGSSTDILNLKIAAQLCKLVKLQSLERIKNWPDHLQRFVDDSSKQKPLVSIQISLIESIHEFHCKQYASADDDQLYKEHLHHLSIVAKFLGQSDASINQLLLRGLLQLEKLPTSDTPVRCFMWKFIKNVLPAADKKVLIDLITCQTRQ